MSNGIGSSGEGSRPAAGGTVPRNEGQAYDERGAGRRREPPAVAIILVNWNGEEDTTVCLDSLSRLEYGNFRVYLVDNASRPESVNRIRDHLQGHALQERTRLILSPTNEGFAGGNNVGIRRARGDGVSFFWLLNNDTEVDPRALSALVTAHRSVPDSGMVGSKIYFAGTDRFWYAGGVVSGVTGRGYARGKGEADRGQYDRQEETGYVTGCSLLVSRAVIASVGLLREDYFMYYEDTDWSLRARNAGYRLLYAPESVVYHKVGMSSRTARGNAPQLIYFNLRNRFTMVQRLASPRARLLSVLHLHYQLFSQFRMIMRRDYRRLEAVKYLLLGYRDALLRRLGPAPMVRG